MVEFVLIWYNERCEICRWWQGCFILIPCTLNQLFSCWDAWHLSLNGLTSESDGLIANLRWQFHCIHDSTFHFCFNLGNFHTGLSRSRGCSDRVGLRWRRLHPYGVGTDNCVSHISKTSSYYQLKRREKWTWIQHLWVSSCLGKFLCSPWLKSGELARGCAVQAYIQRVATSKGFERELV